ncbi:MAG: DUF58 domain-containing protein [Lachnospiraceae bacterium]
MKLLIAFACGALLYFLQSYLYKCFWDRDLTITVKFSDNVVREGGTTSLIETISNKKHLPLPVLQIKFAITRTFLFPKQKNTAVTDQYYRNEFFSVMPYQKITRTYPFICSRRGCFQMTGMDVICKDFFMTRMMLKSLTHPSMICVLPRRLRQVEIPTQAEHLLGELVRQIHRNEDPFEFAGIREYQPYDSMHSMNWKSTARTGSLQVNTFYTTFSKKLVLLLNLDCNAVSRAEELKEEGIRIAASLAARFIHERIPVAFYTNGLDLIMKEPCQIEAGSDGKHIRNIEVALSRIDTGLKPSSFLELLDRYVKPGGDSVEYLLISNYRKKDLCEKYAALKKQGYSMKLFIPEFKAVPLENSLTAAEGIIKWTVRDDY